MGALFLTLIILLTVFGGIGLYLEIRFWLAQSKAIAHLSKELLVNDPDSMSDWFNGVLGKEHPLRPAIDRILATDHAPEASVELIEPGENYVRLLSGIRRYAISVVLLCGIAGTLFSLHAAIPASGLFESVDPNQLATSMAKYQESFRNLQPALANAFWPSICGVIATLLLQAGRFAFLDPAHQNAARAFVAFASSALIPWTLRHKEVSSAATDAASKLEGAANAFANAAQSGVEAVTSGAATTKESLEGLSIATTEGCSQLSQAFQTSAEQIGTAGLAAVTVVEGSTQAIAKAISDLGVALTPIVNGMEGVSKNIRTAADRFDKSVAANGPFLKAMEQLYDASSPAEKRYEQLLVAVTEMQHLSTTQNADLLRLLQESAILTRSVVQTAEESARLAKSLETATASLPATAQAVTTHGEVLTSISKQLQTEVISLTSQFRSFSVDVKTAAGAHRQVANDLLADLPTQIAHALATKLPQELAPLLSSTTIGNQHSIALQDGIRGLQASIEGLRTEMGQIGINGSTGKAAKRIRPKRKWYFLGIK
jgi:hypothetical protein